VDEKTEWQKENQKGKENQTMNIFDENCVPVACLSLEKMTNDGYTYEQVGHLEIRFCLDEPGNGYIVNRKSIGEEELLPLGDPASNIMCWFGENGYYHWRKAIMEIVFGELNEDNR